MKVPRNAENPSYDDVEKVGFWRWLTSSKPDRLEWRRRRDAATSTGRVARKLEATRAEVQRKIDEKEAERDAGYDPRD
jgi:hypothetical protein